MTLTPLSPEEIIINLLGINQVFQLFQSSECSEFKGFPRHISPLKHLKQLSCTHEGISTISKSCQGMSNEVQSQLGDDPLIFAPFFGGLHRLGIENGHGGLGMTPRAGAHGGMEGPPQERSLHHKREADKRPLYNLLNSL